MTEKHTPDDWGAEEDEDCYLIVHRKTCRLVATISKTVYPPYLTKEQIKANANLLLSAPALAAQNRALRDLATKLSDVLAGLTDEYWELLSEEIPGGEYLPERMENYNQVTPILKQARDLGVWKPPSDIWEGHSETDKPA